jgi:two-component system response regulator AtoC
MARHVLVVDDEEMIRWSVVERLRAEGHAVSEAGTAAEAVERAEGGIDLVLLDYHLPDGDGASVLKHINRVEPDALVIMATDHQDGTRTADVMPAGAFDYAAKPFDLDDVAMRVGRALETTRLRRELRIMREMLARRYAPAAIVGESEPMLRLKGLVRKVATSQGSTVLITGESGTGKALAAKVIHYASARADRPFVAIRCAGSSETEIESQMFGRESGARDDAPAHARGLLEQAGDGTVFLDEIAAITPPVQAQLLRVLEDKAFRRVGGTTDIQVDVRVVAATSANLEERVREGKFRGDLYYRLNVLRVEVPPLRARGADIPLLAQHFVDIFGAELMRPVAGVSPAAQAALAAYSWPGNVRELRNLVERAVLLAGEDTLQPGDFEALHHGHAPAAAVTGAFSLPAGGVQLEDVERNLVVQALQRVGGNQTRAAALLGLHRDQIRYRIEKFGLAKKS